MMGMFNVGNLDTESKKDFDYCVDALFFRTVVDIVILAYDGFGRD